jgi:hypothetical protein
MLGCVSNKRTSTDEPCRCGDGDGRVNASAEPLEFVTEQRRGAAFPDELQPPPAAIVARALAGRIGYQIAHDQ